MAIYFWLCWQWLQGRMILQVFSHFQYASTPSSSSFYELEGIFLTPFLSLCSNNTTNYSLSIEATSKNLSIVDVNFYAVYAF